MSILKKPKLYNFKRRMEIKISTRFKGFDTFGDIPRELETELNQILRLMLSWNSTHLSLHFKC